MTNSDLWPVFANGWVVPGDEPVLRAGDQGFTLGLSAFDSLLFEEGTLLFVEEHLDRLERSARGVGIPWPPPWDPRAALLELARAIGADPLVLRTTLSRGTPEHGTTMVVAARPVLSPPPTGVGLWIPTLRFRADARVDGLKTTNRLRNILAREEAARHGAFEALLVDFDERVLEGTISNFFARFGDELRTAPLDDGCLGGITRTHVLRSLAEEPLEGPAGAPLRLVERSVRVDELAGADEMMLTNTSGRVMGVLSVGGIPEPIDGLPGSSGWAARALDGRIRAGERDYRARTEQAPG